MADQVSALEPGLYRATVCGIPDTLVTVRPGAYTTTYAVGRYNEDQHRDIEDARPLIVLEWGHYLSTRAVEVLRADGLDLMADDIEAQTKPARIPEPRDIGVRIKAVACSPADSGDRVRKWTRFSTILVANWIDEDGHKRCWTDLIDPTLIREGVES